MAGPFSRNWLSHGFDEVGILKRGTHNAEIHPSVLPEKGDIIIEKARYSAFYGTRLDNLLKGSKYYYRCDNGRRYKVLHDLYFQGRAVQRLSGRDSFRLHIDWRASGFRVGRDLVPKRWNECFFTTMAIGDGEVMPAAEFRNRIEEGEKIMITRASPEDLVSNASD